MDNIFLAPKNLSELPVISSLPVPTSKLIHVVKPIVFNIGEHEQLALMDKKNTHSLYDMMLIQVGEYSKASIQELTEKELEFTFEVASLFFKFVNEKQIYNFYGFNNGIPRVSYSFDPWTTDREGLQPIKRFHLHMYVMSPEDCDYIRNKKHRYVNIVNAYERRRLVDPVTFISNQILFDIHQHLVKLPAEFHMEFLKPEEYITTGIPLGLNIKIREINKTKLSRYLLNLHKTMIYVSECLYKAFTGGKSIAPSGTRYTLLNYNQILNNLKQIEWLSKTSLCGLSEIANTLRSVPDRLLKNINRYSKWSTHHIVSNGLAYAFSLQQDNTIGNKKNNLLNLNISPRMFSDLGGAGLFGCNGASAIMLNRGIGKYTKFQMSQRWKYQREFQLYIQNNLNENFITSTMHNEEIKKIFKNWSKSKKDKTYKIPNLKFNI